MVIATNNCWLLSKNVYIKCINKTVSYVWLKLLGIYIYSSEIWPFCYLLILFYYLLVYFSGACFTFSPSKSNPDIHRSCNFDSGLDKKISRKLKGHWDQVLDKTERYWKNSKRGNKTGNNRQRSARSVIVLSEIVVTDWVPLRTMSLCLNLYKGCNSFYFILLWLGFISIYPMELTS